MAFEHRFGTWAAPFGFVLFCFGSFMARWAPPISPTLEGAGLVSFYTDNARDMMIGDIAVMFAAALLLPFFAAISSAMLRIDGRPLILAGTQLAAGTMLIMVLTLCAVLFCAASFRNDRSPDEILLLSDLAWLVLVIGAAPFIMQALAIGFAILGDRATCKVFPRWVGYINLLVAFLSLAGGVGCLFKEGPFAWNGLLAYWVPLLAFDVWIFVMFGALLRIQVAQVEAISRDSEARLTVSI
jgi:hypothetical protein